MKNSVDAENSQFLAASSTTMKTVLSKPSLKRDVIKMLNRNSFRNQNLEACF